MPWIDEPHQKTRLRLLIGTAGIVASLLLLLYSLGSNDIGAWLLFASAIQANGLGALYQDAFFFNHPPLMGYFAWSAIEVSEATGVPFPFVFKLPSVIANVGTAVMLMRLWEARGEHDRGSLVFAAYAWSLCAILVGAYHGNTDCIVVFGCVACLYSLETGRPGLAGLALAAAINVKIIPVLAFLPLLAAQRTRAAAIAFTMGAACAAVPFALAWQGAGDAVIDNIFRYDSSSELWGFPALLQALVAIPGVGAERATGLRMLYYEDLGRWMVIGSVVALAVYGFRNRLRPAPLMAATFGLFLVFAPGFGIQYTVYLVAPALAVSLPWGRRYDLVAGVFLLATYLHFRQGTLPLQSFHGDGIPATIAAFGVPAWAAAAALVVLFLREDSKQLEPA